MGRRTGGRCQDPDAWQRPQVPQARSSPQHLSQRGSTEPLDVLGSLGAMGTAGTAAELRGCSFILPRSQHPARALQPHFAFCNHASGVVTATYCSWPTETSCLAPSPPSCPIASVLPHRAPSPPSCPIASVLPWSRAHAQSRDLPTQPSDSLKIFSVGPTNRAQRSVCSPARRFI